MNYRADRRGTNKKKSVETQKRKNETENSETNRMRNDISELISEPSCYVRVRSRSF